MTVQKARILAIDDTPENLMTLGAALTAEFELQVATSGREGVDRAKASPPDLILLDVMMPEMDGFETCRLLKDDPVLRSIPVIFLTALTSHEAEMMGLELGAADYITKPVNVQVARHRIRNLLERERLRKEVEAQRSQLETRLAELELAQFALRQSEGRLAEAQRMARIGSWELDLASNQLIWSEEIFRIFEIDKTHFGSTYEAFLSAIHPEDRDTVNATYTRSLETRTPYGIDHRLLMPDGRIKYVHEECETVFGPEGKPIRSVGTVQDITERKLIEEEQRIAAIAFETHDGLMITDSKAKILRVNRAFSRVTGYSAEEVIGKTPAILQSGRQGREFYSQLWQQLLRNMYWAGEVWNRRKNGEIYPEWLNITALPRPDGVVTHYVASFSDITDRKVAEEQIHRLAFYDQLTNLPNRRLLHDRCGQALRACARHKEYGAVLFLDLDRFKVINDTMGHEVGDLLLIEVARRLLASVRAEDTVARWGGDEFVVLLQEIGPQSELATERAKMVAGKILTTLNAPYSLNGHTCDSSSSIGICLFDGTSESISDVFMGADKAMYEAKAAGRNTVCVFAEHGGEGV